MHEEIDVTRLQSRSSYYAKQLGVQDNLLGMTGLSASDRGYFGLGALRYRILPVQMP